MTKVVMPISTNGAAERISESPANCPAEVRLVMEISAATHTGRPLSTHINPNTKDTET